VNVYERIEPEKRHCRLDRSPVANLYVSAPLVMPLVGLFEKARVLPVGINEPVIKWETLSLRTPERARELPNRNRP